MRAAPPTRSPRSSPRNAVAPTADAVRLSQEVLRHLPSGIVFFNRDGRVDEANPAARIALDFARPQGLTLAELFRDAELREPDGTNLGNAAKVMAETYRTHRILQRKTMRYTTPQGESRRLGVTLFPLRSQAGPASHPASSSDAAPQGLICLLTDLTTIHALENELQLRKNLSALGEMAAGIAHEFKNGLATISGYGQMLHASLDGGSRAQVAKILEQVGMLNNIATEFLTFARPLAVQPERVPLGPLLRQCADALRAQDFAAVSIELEPDYPTVMGDAALLTSAFINLVRNACEAIAQRGGKGRISIVSAGRQVGAESLVRLHIVDDGPGVPAEVAEKIFIPFFTTKASGTGLGLAMVHKIITAHRGSVSLAEAAAGHTVFAVLLPAAP